MNCLGAGRTRTGQADISCPETCLTNAARSQRRRGRDSRRLQLHQTRRIPHYPPSHRDLRGNCASICINLATTVKRESSPDTGVRGGDTSMACGSRRISERNFDSSQGEDPGFQAADGTRDHFTIPSCCASSPIFLSGSNHRAEDSLGVWVSGRSGGLPSRPILVDRRDVFSCCLEETLGRAYNADSDYGVVSCSRLLCLASYPSPNAASKGPRLASRLLNRVGLRSLFHHPSSGGVRKISDRFFSYGVIQIVPSPLVAQDPDRSRGETLDSLDRRVH